MIVVKGKICFRKPIVTRGGTVVIALEEAIDSRMEGKTISRMKLKRTLL
jgi:hypothetical protein